MGSKSTMSTNELRVRTREEATRYQESQQRLCDYLTVIDQTHLWRPWGFSSLCDYVEKELKMSHR